MKRSWILLTCVGFASFLFAFCSHRTPHQRQSPPPTRNTVSETDDTPPHVTQVRRLRSKAPATNAPTTQPQTVTWIVRDLADETTVPGLTLTIDANTSGVEREFATDADGRVELPVDYASVPEVEAGYTVAGKSIPDEGMSETAVPSVTTLWVFAQLQVECVVSCNVEGPSNVRLEFDVVTGPNAHWDETERAKRRSSPFRRAWIDDHGLGRRTIERHVSFVEDDPEGAGMRFSVPRVRGAALVLRDRDLRLRPVVHPLEVSSDIAHVTVRLEMHLDDFVSGQVDSDLPLPPNTRVKLYVRTRKPWREIDFARQMRGTHAVGIRVKLIDGDSVAEMNLAKSVLVASDGSFRIPLPGRGQAILELLAPGHPPRRQELGQLVSGRDGIALHLPPNGPPRSLRFTRDGEPMRGAVLHFADGSASAGQPSRGPFTVGDDASIDGRFLLHGHDYFVIAELPDGESRITGWFTWIGQSSLDFKRDLRRSQ